MSPVQYIQVPASRMHRLPARQARPGTCKLRFTGTNEPRAFEKLGEAAATPPGARPTMRLRRSNAPLMPGAIPASLHIPSQLVPQHVLNVRPVPTDRPRQVRELSDELV